MAPTAGIQNVLDQYSLKWIFVGGKGGVGKTTCSCCIAVHLANIRERVLIISTDPAHNLSDAFDQKFSKSPTLVKGFSNLYAMEIDPNLNLGEFEEEVAGAEEAALSADFRRTLTHIMTTFPGIDEYMSYTEVFRLVQSLEYSVVVFDTAPTGHTLRLLSFPDLMEKSLSNVVRLKNQLLPFMNQVLSFLGISSARGDDITQTIDNRLPIIREITKQFKDPQATTFICVCISEFLSMYETERLVQELAAQEIDIHNIIVNQLLFPNMRPVCEGEENDPPTNCRMCTARYRVQSKYLEQILELYDDMHITQLPLLENEIRGIEKVRSFAEYFLKPFSR